MPHTCYAKSTKFKHRFATVMRLSQRNELLFFKFITPLVLITRLLTGRADIPVISAVQIKIPSYIKYHKLNMITLRNST